MSEWHRPPAEEGWGERVHSIDLSKYEDSDDVCSSCGALKPGDVCEDCGDM
jgi:hypothetical protein